MAGLTPTAGSVAAVRVFKITTTGLLTTLYLFCRQNGCTAGGEATAGLVQATDGNFYGTTQVGGTNNDGTVFKITPTGTLTTLYSFCNLNGCMDGAEPAAGLMQATDGNFYGVTYEGGANNDGTVFSLSATNYTLTVSVSGTGTVTSQDLFITCPTMCSHLYPANTPVTLNANQPLGWTFAGWSGACTGMGPCNVTMTQSQSVTATFSQQTYLLNVSITSPSGSGTVTSTDGGINCPGTCGNSYPVNTSVTLNETPAPGWSFAGWSGRRVRRKSFLQRPHDTGPIGYSYLHPDAEQLHSECIDQRQRNCDQHKRHQLSWHMHFYLSGQHASHPE